MADRLTGYTGDTAIKVPCRLATTAAITLSGEQTIDGVAAVAGDRVLVKNQTDTTANGIYIVSTSAWARSADWDGARDVVNGTQVAVVLGTVSAGLFYTASCTDPFTIGAALTFTYSALPASSAAAAAISAAAASDSETAAGVSETNAAASAAAALVSENNAAASEAATAADVVTTNADVVLTHADVVLTNADVVSAGNSAADAAASAAAAAAIEIAAPTHAATSKTTPVDADELPLVDSAASFGLKRLTWANLKTVLAAACSAGWNAATATLADAVTATKTSYTPTLTNITAVGGIVSTTYYYVVVGKVVHVFIYLGATTVTINAGGTFTAPLATDNTILGEGRMINKNTGEICNFYINNNLFYAITTPAAGNSFFGHFKYLTT